MRAAVVTDDHGLDVGEVPEPAPGPDDLVLRVTHCGICGSDLKAIHNMPPGLVMGHEFCGEVVATGNAVEGTWRDGQLVAALPLIGCGHCRRCLAGDVAHCAEVSMLGVGGGPGAYAEFVRVSARESVALSDDIRDAGWGALVEPLAVGLHAVARAAIQPGERVLVIGGGPIGLAVIVWARRVGAGEIVVWEPVEARRKLAGIVGASAVLDPAEDHDRGGYDVVFECVGRSGLIANGIAAAGVGGRVIVVGVCTEPDPLVPVAAIMKELRVDFVVYYTRNEFAYVADEISRGRLDPSALITDRIGLDDLDAMFRSLREPSTQTKVLVTP